MSLYYFDTSALVKYYVSEPGSTWVREVIDAHGPTASLPVHIIFISSVTIAEVSSALAVLRRHKLIARQQSQQAYDHFLANIEDRLALVDILLSDYYQAAELTQRHPLKAYDAIQLAVALRFNQILASHQLSLIFVSGDQTQLVAAQAEGLATVNPLITQPKQPQLALKLSAIATRLLIEGWLCNKNSTQAGGSASARF